MGQSQITKQTGDEDVDKIRDSFDGKKIVIQKLLDSPVYRERLEKDQETLNRFAEVLSSITELKKTYLTTDWAETINLMDTLHTKTEKFIEDKKDTGFSSTSDHGDTEIKVDSLKLSEEELKNAKLDPELQKTLKSKVKVKLVIAEVAQTNARKNLRELISPILSKLDVLPEFGMFHTALIIGPWLIEWNNSALCIPRKCVSKAALLTADIDSIGTEKKLEEVIDKLADYICKWNTKKYYKDNTLGQEKYGNCQDFCNGILEELGINTEHIFKGALGNFLTKIRKEGKSEMEFEMSKEFRERFKQKEDKITFKSHEELDKFVISLQNIEIEFEIKYKSEWLLLKSFDRAFWLRFYKFKDEKKFQPLMKQEEMICPFGNPEETGSLRFTKSGNN